MEMQEAEGLEEVDLLTLQEQSMLLEVQEETLETQTLVALEETLPLHFLDLQQFKLAVAVVVVDLVDLQSSKTIFKDIQLYITLLQDILAMEHLQVVDLEAQEEMDLELLMLEHQVLEEIQEDRVLQDQQTQAVVAVVAVAVEVDIIQFTIGEHQHQVVPRVQVELVES
jgi:hypothetical protein